MKRKYKAKPKRELELAKERVATLFAQAELRFKEDPELSNRYVKLARKIAMKVKYSIPPKYKRRYCKHCYTYLVPNKNCRVRTTGKTITYSCFSCKKFMRFRYK